MAIRGVILDVDGTLVDSNDAHARSWVKALHEHGIDVPFDKVRRLIGMGGDKLLPAVTGIAEDTRQGKAITRRRKEIFEERYLPHLEPTRGAQELIEALHGRGLKLAVASSAKPDELEPLLRICGAEGLIGPRTSSGDADRSKPDPDIVHVALGRIALGPHEAIMLGDTPYDIEAAGRARVGTVALRCGGWGNPQLSGALAIYEDPADLRAHLDESPFVKGASGAGRGPV